MYHIMVNVEAGITVQCINHTCSCGAELEYVGESFFPVYL